jgi:hypothetical protein
MVNYISVVLPLLLISGCKDETTNSPATTEDDTSPGGAAGKSKSSSYPSGRVKHSTTVKTDQIEGGVALTIDFGLQTTANVEATVELKWSSHLSAVNSGINCRKSGYTFNADRSAVHIGSNGDCVETAIKAINAQIPEGETKLPCPIVVIRSSDPAVGEGWYSTWTSAIFGPQAKVKVPKIPKVEVPKIPKIPKANV